MPRSSTDQLRMRQRLVVSDGAAELVLDQLPRRNGDVRTAWQRDVDRIKYSREFQRLAGVTQVASPRGDHQLHDRLTHSLKVAQLGVRLADAVPRPQDAPRVLPDVIEAACLAHDLGHPPFGHVGEETIDALCRDGRVASHPGASWHRLKEGFEGNAQSLRIVTELARRGGTTGELRLDLTVATLNAIVKYPWERLDDERDDEHLAAHDSVVKARPSMDTDKKRGVYATEVTAFRLIRGVEGGGAAWPRCCPWPSLEASIMEIADDVTYAVHDLFDFFRAGLIPFGAFLAQHADNEVHEVVAAELAGDALAYEDALERVREAAATLSVQLKTELSDLDHVDSRIAEASISDATSSIIGWLARHLAYVRRPTGTWNLDWSSVEAEQVVAVLHALTRRFVIKSPSLGLLQAGQQRMIEDVFVALVTDTTGAAEPRLLPTHWRTSLSRDADGDFVANVELTRVIRDYVASLSEDGVTTLHALTAGLHGASPFGGTFRYGIV